MKRLISTALAIALLLGLGALAVLARGGGDILTPAGSVVAAAAQPSTGARHRMRPRAYGWSSRSLCRLGGAAASH